MRELPAGRMLGLSGTLFAWILVVSGCNSIYLLPPNQSANLVSKAKAEPVAVVQPGMELEWRCTAPVEPPGMVRSGKSVVGPDGGLVLGPYGACKVAGLTLQQAGGRAEKQLASYIKQPRVTLAAVARAQAADEIVWKKAGPGDALARHQPPRKDETIRPVVGTVQQLPKEPSPGPILPFTPAASAVVAVNPGKGEIVAPPLAMRHGGKHRPGGPMLALPHGPNEMTRVTLPEYIIRPPDVLVIESTKGLIKKVKFGDKEIEVPQQAIKGSHLVRPDGTVSVGIYGPALVAGKTVEEARLEIARAIKTKGELTLSVEEIAKDTSVDVLAYNSSFYYVITDGAGQGEQVARFPVTGNETVLDAISLINGLSPVSSPRRIWVARRNPGMGGADSIYPVDWRGIAMQGSTATNWQIMPGDRVYVQADPVRRFNSTLQKFLEPVERLMGGTLLGSQTINSIRTGTTGFR